MPAATAQRTGIRTATQSAAIPRGSPPARRRNGRAPSGLDSDAGLDRRFRFSTARPASRATDQFDVRLDDRGVFGRQTGRDLLGLDDPALTRLDHHLGGGRIGLRDLKADEDGDRGNYGRNPENDVSTPAQDREQFRERQPAWDRCGRATS